MSNDDRDAFAIETRELTDKEIAHLKAAYATANQYLSVCNSDMPDPHWRDEAIKYLRISVMCMKRAIELGIRLP